jgi:hypothetical protein
MIKLFMLIRRLYISNGILIRVIIDTYELLFFNLSILGFSLKNIKILTCTVGIRI